MYACMNRGMMDPRIDTVLRVYIANIYFYYSIERFPSRNGYKVTNLKHEHRISTAQCAVLAQHQ